MKQLCVGASLCVQSYNWCSIKNSTWETKYTVGREKKARNCKILYYFNLKPSLALSMYSNLGNVLYQSRSEELHLLLVPPLLYCSSVWWWLNVFNRKPDIVAQVCAWETFNQWIYDHNGTIDVIATEEAEMNNVKCPSILGVSCSQLKRRKKLTKCLSISLLLFCLEWNNKALQLAFPLDNLKLKTWSERWKKAFLQWENNHSISKSSYLWTLSTTSQLSQD